MTRTLEENSDDENQEDDEEMDLNHADGIIDCEDYVEFDVPRYNDSRRGNRLNSQPFVVQWNDNGFFRVPPINTMDDIEGSVKLARETIIKTQQAMRPQRLGNNMERLHSRAFVPPDSNEGMVLKIYQRKNHGTRKDGHIYYADTWEDYSLPESVKESCGDVDKEEFEACDEVIVWIRSQIPTKMSYMDQGAVRQVGNGSLKTEGHWSTTEFWNRTRHEIGVRNVSVDRIYLEFTFQNSEEDSEVKTGIRLDNFLRRDGTTGDYILASCQNDWIRGSQFPWHQISIRLLVLKRNFVLGA